MKLNVLTPEKTVVELDHVASVTAETSDGQFGILPHHQPLTASLKIALLHYTPNGESGKVMAIMGGVLQTDGEKITVLSQSAEHANDIDEARTMQAKQRAEERLAKHNDNVDTKRAELALSRAMTRMKALSLN